MGVGDGDDLQNQSDPWHNKLAIGGVENGRRLCCPLNNF